MYRTTDLEKKKSANGINKSSGWEDDAKNWLAGPGKNLGEVGEAAGASAVVGAIIGSFFGGIGAVPGAIGGAIIGGVIAALGKTAPQVQNIAVNAKDTASQLSDLLKAIPKDQNFAEYSFIFDFINAVNMLASRATDYDSLLGSLQGNPDSAQKITEAFQTQVATVEGFISKFREKSMAGVYKSFVSHSKALTPVYLFMDDNIEDVEKSCQSLDAAIQEHDAAMKNVKAAIPSAVSGAATQKDQPGEGVTQQSTNKPNQTPLPITPQTKPISNVFKALNINNPNDKQIAFVQDLMGGTQ